MPSYIVSVTLAGQEKTNFVVSGAKSASAAEAAVLSGIVTVTTHKPSVSTLMDIIKNGSAGFVFIDMMNKPCEDRTEHSSEDSSCEDGVMKDEPPIFDDDIIIEDNSDAAAVQ